MRYLIVTPDAHEWIPRMCDDTCTGEGSMSTRALHLSPRVVVNTGWMGVERSPFGRGYALSPFLLSEVVWREIGARENPEG